MFGFHYSVLMFAEGSKSGWFSLILTSSVSNLLDSTAFSVHFCKLNQLDWLFTVLWLEWHFFFLSQCATGIYTKFSVKLTFLVSWYAQKRGKNVSFSENFAYLLNWCFRFFFFEITYKNLRQYLSPIYGKTNKNKLGQTGQNRARNCFLTIFSSLVISFPLSCIVW